MQVKILKLEINNLRGIRHLELKPEGENFLISGPNGSGKSAIVDAVDFLLTGQVSRMTGPGTKGIKLKDHGPHIDSSVKDVKVSALIELNGKELEIERHLSKPKKLVYDTGFKEQLEPVLELASRGQHVLTRREILNYVTADTSTRGKQITNLLNLQDIEKTRTALMKVKKTLKSDFYNAQSNLNDAESRIIGITDLDKFDPKELLGFINENRLKLGGNPLDEIKLPIIENLKKFTTTNSPVNSELLIKDINNLNNFLKKYRHWNTLGDEYYKLKDSFSDAPIQNLRLTKLGLGLVKGDNCPLCDTQWDKEELKTHLENKISKLDAASKTLNRMEEIIQETTKELTITLASLDEVINNCSILGLSDELKDLEDWKEDLLNHKEKLNDDNYPKWVKPQGIDDLLQNILDELNENVQGPTPEDTALDRLTRLEENIKSYFEAQKNLISIEKAYNKAEILFDAFITSRNKILNDLYTEIKDKFVELYRELHMVDESDFDAILISDGAGVDFQVEFHGKGKHPPHALHSEGHQDSMGICLYLALADKLTENIIDLIVLDDVMMSVDAPHRRKICNLLASFFEGRQFFITTHDQTWAKQLQYEGVVTSKNKVELSNWTLEHGPMANSLGDMWERINNDLKHNEISSAAARLRRGFEEYFTLICGALQAPVKYKASNQHELGDLLSGGISAYNKLLKKAKTSARSWGKTVELEKLEEIEKYSKDVFRRNNTEKWAVNPAVHFNKWAEFTPQDFKPVIDSFYDLYTLFQCNTCGTVIHLTLKDNEQEAVKCNCGDYLWNLKGK